MKCSYFCAYCEFCASVCGWIITLYCVAFGLSQKCFPPEQERPASVRIGLGFSFSWNTFCSVLHGPTGDHSADIFRGHVPRASVAKREGQWRVWCYINTWRKWGKEKTLGGLDEFSTAFPQGISQFKSTLTERGPKMAAPVYTHPAPVQPHLHTFGATHSLSSGSVNCVRGEKNRLTPNVPLRSFQTSRGTLIGVGLKMAASEVQRLFFHPAKA